MSEVLTRSSEEQQLQPTVTPSQQTKESVP